MADRVERFFCFVMVAGSIVFAMGCLAGWILNLIKFAGMIANHAPVDGLMIGRAVGIPVAVLGAALGYF